MSKVICVECECSMRKEESGVCVVEWFRNNRKIYKLWSADLFRCKLCDKIVVADFANEPFAEHFKDNMKERLAEEVLHGKAIIHDKELK